MFTVLSNTRHSNLYLIAALAAATIILLTLAIVPVISAPQSVLVPVTGSSETTSDYFQRHPELKMPALADVDPAGDYFERHPELNAGMPLVESQESTGLACESPVDCR